jgi:hypothetical protein
MPARARELASFVAAGLAPRARALAATVQSFTRAR